MKWDGWTVWQLTREAEMGMLPLDKTCTYVCGMWHECLCQVCLDVGDMGGGGT